LLLTVRSCESKRADPHKATEDYCSNLPYYMQSRMNSCLADPNSIPLVSTKSLYRMKAIFHDFRRNRYTTRLCLKSLAYSSGLNKNSSNSLENSSLIGSNGPSSTPPLDMCTKNLFFISIHAHRSLYHTLLY
jgi:hypothetical protein